MRNDTANRRRLPAGIALPLAVGLGAGTAWIASSNGGLPREAAFMAGIFVLAAALWVTEAIPLFATSLIVIALQAILLANPGQWPGLGFQSRPSPGFREILAAAVDPVLVLFFGGFVLAQAAVKEGVDRAMSALLLRPFGGDPRWVLLGVMLVTMSFGMWMSNTATATMMLALVAPMAASLPPGEPFRKALVLGVPFAANISGMGTPIASPPNAIALGFLQEAGHSIPFVKWMLVGVPLTVGMVLFAWALLFRRYSPRNAGLRLQTAPSTLTRRGRVVVGVFTVTVLLWLSDQWHGLPPSLVALLPAVALTASGLFNRDDLNRLEWRILILIAGGISLGAGMHLTGLDHAIAGALPAKSASAPTLLAILALATVAVGTFMSNTAAANLFLPIGISVAAANLAQGGGLHPIQAAMCIALVASVSMALPISTPPNALAYSTGEISTRDLAVPALIVSALSTAAIILGAPFIMRFWGLFE